MKKVLALVAIIAVILVSVSACALTNPKSDTQLKETLIKTNTDTNKTLPEDKIAINDGEILEMESFGDWSKAAKDIKSLYDESELVIRGKIRTVDYYCSNGGMIYTNFLPEVIETYKGNYDGSIIKSIGGIVNYDEYLKHDANAKEFKNFAPNIKDNAPKKVQLSFGGISIVKPEDEFIIFIQKLEGQMDITNGFQGLYKISSDKVSNKALKDGGSLNEDIEKKVREKQASKSTASCSIVEGLDKSAFISVIKDLKN